MRNFSWIAVILFVAAITPSIVFARPDSLVSSESPSSSLKSGSEPSLTAANAPRNHVTNLTGACGTRMDSDMKQQVEDFIHRHTLRTRSRKGPQTRWIGSSTARDFNVHVWVVSTISPFGWDLSSGPQLVTEAMARTRVTQLNTAFNGMASFTLRSFAYVYTDVFGVPPDIDSAFDRPNVNSVTQRFHIGGSGDLNIYVSRISHFNGWSSWPWELSTYPDRDGIWIADYTFPLGTRDFNFQEGDSVVHEVGHWSGLYHVFEGGCAGYLSTAGGDQVADTNPQAGFDLTTTSCTAIRHSCSRFYSDDKSNFMNYAVDACRNKFTAGQKTRMLSTLASYRSVPFPTILQRAGAYAIFPQYTTGRVLRSYINTFNPFDTSVSLQLPPYEWGSSGGYDKFLFVPVNPSSNIVQIKPAGDFFGANCLALPLDASSTATNTKIGLNNCLLAGASANWKLVQVSGQRMILQPQHVAGQCLEVYSGTLGRTTSVGALMHIRTCVTGSLKQQFVLVRVSA